MTRLHANELEIDIGLVRRLIDTQMPKHAHKPLRALKTSGSTNRLFWLGDDMLVRLPRQPGGGDAVVKEARWVSKLTVEIGDVGICVPEVIYVGTPDFGFSESWSVMAWLAGDHPSTWLHSSMEAQTALAKDLANVIKILRHQPLPDKIDPTLLWYRGSALSEFNAATLGAIETCRDIPGFPLDLDLVADVWRQAMDLPRSHVAATDAWYHADLVAENLLVRDGRLHAVLDWGVMGVGDPTVDLHGAWELFGADARAVFQAELSVSEEDWFCGRAWALGIALSCFAYYWDTMPERCADRLIMARAVLDDVRSH